jgi:hypothetical protein
VTRVSLHGPIPAAKADGRRIRLVLPRSADSPAAIGAYEPWRPGFEGGASHTGYRTAWLSLTPDLPSAMHCSIRDDEGTRYWITLSAVAKSVSGMVRPSALAVLRLMTSSNLAGCSTGRSAGFVPLRMRST